ncbi:hypothetical protein IJG93_00740 [Candidatus Saccharibacteria bacterium]|nr:hypothetical protein [Candidatus Saccharibacteria bacterium]
MPSDDQTRSIGPNIASKVYISDFSPVPGGRYGNGSLFVESTHGYWWGSTVYNGASRYYLGYSSNGLYTNNYNRLGGFYVRCIQAS